MFFFHFVLCSKLQKYLNSIDDDEDDEKEDEEEEDEINFDNSMTRGDDDEESSGGRGGGFAQFGSPQSVQSTGDRDSAEEDDSSADEEGFGSESDDELPSPSTD
jgi:hypothetical protein